MFSTKHVIILICCIALIIGLFILSKKLKFDTLCKTLLGVGIVSELIKIFYYIVRNEATHGGILPKTDLPFHLCSIQILFITYYNFSNNEKLKRAVLSFMYPSCLIGGIAAILIPTTSSLNGMWIITAQYFLYHVAIIVFALNICTNKELKLTYKDYFSSLIFIGVLMFFAIYVNSIIDDGSGKINFMYVVSPPVDGLPFLTEKYGWLVYIVHYGFLVLFCLTACYTKPILTKIKEVISLKKEKPTQVDETISNLAQIEEEEKTA